MDKSKIIEQFTQLNCDELHELNEGLVTILRDKRRQADVVASFNWSKGDKVQFVGKKGVIKVGTVAERKNTRVIVEVKPLFGTFPERWTVHASSLKKAEGKP